jgi:hypothetical protein
MSKDKLKNDPDTWQKTLTDILHQNALLKYMLSEIVDENEDKDFLPTAEYFQNELLLNDEKVRILIKEVNEFEAMFLRDCDEKYKQKYEKLEHEILDFKKNYHAFSRNFKLKCYKKAID